MYMQCFFFLLLSNIQKLNKILLKCFEFDFYENILWRRMHTCMHGSNDDGCFFFFNSNNKPRGKQLISK